VALCDLVSCGETSNLSSSYRDGHEVIQGVLKNSFATLKAYINLLRGNVQSFELS
jgi:hypothetical protein